MDASAAVSSRLIGAIFVEKGLVTPDQLERAMQIQAETGDRLGEVIVAEFGVARLELASVLAEQWAEFERTDPPQDAPLSTEPSQPDEIPVEPLLRRPIGEIFVDRGFVTDEQLEKAVEVQSKTGQRIGEVLVEQGSLSRLDLASALAEQWSNLQKLRPPEPVEQDPWHGGAVVVPPAAEVSRELSASLADLESRVRVVERAAAASPWEEDLGRLSTELRAAIVALEQRAAPTDGGAESTEGLKRAVAELRERVDAPIARLEALEQRVVGAVTADMLDARLAALDQLSGRLDELAQRASSPEALDEVRARVEELAAGSTQNAGVDELRAEIAQLAERVHTSETSAAPGLADKLDAVAGQAEAAHTELTALVSRLDDLTGLQERVADLAGRVPGEELVGEMRRALSELAARTTDHPQSDDDYSASIVALGTRLDQLAAQVEEVTSEASDAGNDELRTAIDALRSRIDELQARPVADGEALQERLQALEQKTFEVTAGDVAEMTRTLEEQRLQFDDRLGEVAAAVSDTSELDTIRLRLEELAAASAASAEASALDERIAALEHRLVDLTPVSELREEVQRVAASAAGERATLERALLARVEEITTGVPAVDEFAALRDRVAELAARPAVDESLRAQVDELATRLDAAASVGESMESLRQTFAALDAARAEDARATSERLQGIEQALASFGDLTARVDAAAAAGDSVESLRQTFAALDAARAEDTRATSERLQGIEQALASFGDLTARVDAAAAAGDSVESLRQTFAALDAARAEDTRATSERLGGLEQALASFDDLTARLDAAAAAGDSVESLRQTFAALDAARANDALATGARLQGLEQAISAVDGLGEKMRTVVAESDGALAERVEDAQRRLDELASLEGRLAELRDDVSSRVQVDAFAETESALRAELEALTHRLERQEHELAARPSAPDQTARIDGIGVRLDQHTRDLQGRLTAFSDDVTTRIDGLELRTEGLVGRDELGATIAEQAGSLGAELDAVRAAAHALERNLADRIGSLAERSSVDAIDERVAAAEESLTSGFRLIETMRDATAARLDEAVGALRGELDGRDSRIDERITAQRLELSARHDEIVTQQGEIVAQLAELRELSAARDAWQSSVEARLDARVDERLTEVSERLAAESARVQSEIEQSAEALRAEVAGSSDSLRSELDASRQALRLELEGSRDAVGIEVGSLAMRLDELQGLHRADTAAARLAVDALGARVDEFHSLRAQDAEAAQEAAAEAGARLDQLGVSLRREAAVARETADRVAARVEELEGVHADDAESTRIAAAELVARLDDLALRTAGAAAETEKALRDELSGVAARMEEQDAGGIEAREELRVELERVSSSVGWRLERIEESLASDDSEALRAALTEVERRLDDQLSHQDEQVRVTERALRKGLASLGERLVDSETAYHEAGTALRRSIERLGAAVVEADARMAEQIPVSEVEGYVAFAPTAEGYRLVPVPGRPPELGAVVEVEGCEGPLVVTRYGRSPLPLDNRRCAYLDRS